MKHILLNNLGSQHSRVLKFGQFNVILLKKIFYQKKMGLFIFLPIYTDFSNFDYNFVSF